MIISIDTEKAFDKIQHPFTIKTLSKVGIKGPYLNIIKAIYDKPTGSIILTGQKLQVFPLRSGIRQGCLLHLSYSIVHSTGSPSHSSQRRRNKRHPNQKGRNKTVFICRWLEMYIENPKDSTKKLLELINEFSKEAGYQINIQKSASFLYAKTN